MAISKQQAQATKQAVKLGQSYVTGTLDGTTSVEDVKLAYPAQKVSFQGSADLAGNLTFSLDGVNFGNSTAIAGTNGVATYSTHMVAVIRVTRTGGTGKVCIVCQ